MELTAIEKLILPVLERYQCELVELKWTQESSMKILQCAVMFEDGSMDLETCSQISSEISPILDESSLKDMTYYLEVCSPGAERELKDDHDIERSIMKEVKILFHHRGQYHLCIFCHGSVLSFLVHDISCKDTLKARNEKRYFLGCYLNSV